jgi:hypothetical protein
MSNATIVSLYATLLQTSLELDKLVAEKLRGGFLADSLIAELAEVHAEKYGACFVLQESGWKFYTSEEAISANRHEAAQKQWNRCIAKFHNIKKDARGGTRAKAEPKAEWQKLGDAALKLSKADLHRFLKYIGRA